MVSADFNVKEQTKYFFNSAEMDDNSNINFLKNDDPDDLAYLGRI